MILIWILTENAHILKDKFKNALFSKFYSNIPYFLLFGLKYLSYQNSTLIYNTHIHHLQA